MADTIIPQLQKAIFTAQDICRVKEKYNAEVVQDKIGFPSDRTASSQPVRIADELRTDGTITICDCSKFISERKNPLEPLTHHARPEVKEEAERRARKVGLTLSHFSRHIYELGLKYHRDMECGEIKKDVLAKQFRDDLGLHCNRHASIGLDTRAEATKARIGTELILNYLLKEDPALFEDYVKAIAVEAESILSPHKRKEKKHK